MALANTLFACGHKPGDWKDFSGVMGTITGIQEPRRGYLFCNGTAVSRTTYAALFAAIGTTYGVGDGSTTFNLPDHRDRMVIYKGATKATLGATGGTLGHTHTVASHHHDVPSHSHSMQAHVHSMQGHSHTFSTGGPTTVQDIGNVAANATYSAAGHGHGGTTDAPGVANTGGSSIGNTDANSALTSDATAGTGAADPPFRVHGGVLVRY